jgi:elongation factor P
MPAITTNDLKNGITLQLDNGLFAIVDFQHVKPGKGGAFVRTKLKNIRTGQVIDRTFNAGIRVEQAMIDKSDMQFLYREGDDDYVFMDTHSYEQITVPRTALGEAADYLVESAVAQVAMFGTEIVAVELPASVELTIAETEPGIQGDRVSGARKPATLDTGKVIQVPLFINIGDKVKVDTRSGDYITRV